MHELRRNLLIQYAVSQASSVRFDQLNEIIKAQMQTLINNIHAKRNASGINSVDPMPIEIKPIIMHACANIFTQYFCSRDFPSDNVKFQEMIRNCDSIFWELNQIHPVDFLPFLLPFYSDNFELKEKCGHEIHEFILEKIIEDRREKWTKDKNGQMDYVDSLIDHVQREAEPKMEWEDVLYGLDDILTAHAGIGNFLMKIFGFIGALPEVQQKIFDEVNTTLLTKCTGTCNVIELSDRNHMPYTEAVIMESLRLIASPIIPHVANQTSSIGGYLIEKDSVIFLNHYDLCMSSELWDEPTAFKPERFIQNGKFVKPDHVLPFSAGQRSCLGANLTELISFSVVSICMQHFSMHPPANITHNVEVGTIAVPEKSYEMIFIDHSILKLSSKH